MARFKPYNVDQPFLLPASLHDYVPDGHLAKLVHGVVEQLDTGVIEIKYSDLGQHTYHPKLLMKILFYGYSIGERSGRKLARRCETDTAYMYLAQGYRPDFRTINDFRKNNLAELSGYFVEVVGIIREMGLVKLGQINIDSTKLKANASKRRSKSEKEYREWLEGVKKRMDEILREADEVDAEEDRLYGDKRGDELPEEINTDEKMKRKLEEVLKRLKEDKTKKKVNLTDHDAQFVRTGHGRIDVGYNCQAAVSEDQIIVVADISEEASDYRVLPEMVEEAEAVLGEEVKEVVADSGYSSYETYEYLESRGKIGYIPDQAMVRQERVGVGSYELDRFTYDRQRDEYICPEGGRLKRHSERREVCGRKVDQVIYRGVACAGCIRKALCTKDKARRLTIDRRKILVDRMRARLRSEEGRQKYRKRLHTVEPIFGHLKHNLGFRQFLLRGMEKVRGEFRLMCIGYNLKRLNKLVAPAG